jgi:hypothetical protein
MEFTKKNGVNCATELLAWIKAGVLLINYKDILGPLNISSTATHLLIFPRYLLYNFFHFLHSVIKESINIKITKEQWTNRIHKFIPWTNKKQEFSHSKCAEIMFRQKKKKN